MNGFLDIDDRAPRNHPGPPLADVAHHDALNRIARGLRRWTPEPGCDRRRESLAIPPTWVHPRRMVRRFGAGGPCLPGVVMDDAARFVALCACHRNI